MGLDETADEDEQGCAEGNIEARVQAKAVEESSQRNAEERTLAASASQNVLGSLSQ